MNIVLSDSNYTKKVQLKKKNSNVRFANISYNCFGHIKEFEK